MGGKLKCRNVVGFFILALNLLCINTLATLSTEFAQLAGVNPGIIICIWSLTPVFLALCDWVYFKQRLRYHHMVGTLSIIVSTVIINLKDVFKSSSGEPVQEGKMPIWIPVILGLI